ncbi:NAD(P)-dependent oxidoreductase [Peptostreptococcus faecalis]|uniref:NAD(P)-dependent oxidoreductase n=1 Tax=Peptostreptococcus faecalis TaxID=2045015 RepID=UPI000C7E5F19|nr:NAD(P)-dependent oxidoreductase [Peptostreptococcus faecalis]
MKRIAFIGAGIMGKNMIRNFLKKGIHVDFYSRTKENALDIIDEGANWCDSIAECITNHDIIISMVGFPSDVQEIYLGDSGIILNAKEHAYLIDMTTTDPNLSIEIGKEAKKRNLHFLDAPVTGGDESAKNGTLTIMVGSESVDFERCYPVFKCLGNIIIHEGPVGSGQKTKMANQIAVAANIAGVCESLYFAQKSGLDVNKVLITISTGAASSFQMDTLAPKILDEDFEPGFFAKHLVKDMDIVHSEAKNINIDLPILEEILNTYRKILDEGYGDLGTQALYKYYDKEID